MLREFLDSDVAAPFTTGGGGWTVGAILALYMTGFNVLVSTSGYCAEGSLLAF